MKIKASGTDALILYAYILKFSYKFVKHVHKVCDSGLHHDREGDHHREFYEIFVKNRS